MEVLANFPFFQVLFVYPFLTQSHLSFYLYCFHLGQLTLWTFRGVPAGPTTAGVRRIGSCKAKLRGNPIERKGRLPKMGCDVDEESPAFQLEGMWLWRKRMENRIFLKTLEVWMVFFKNIHKDYRFWSSCWSICYQCFLLGCQVSATAMYFVSLWLSNLNAGAGQRKTTKVMAFG